MSNNQSPQLMATGNILPSTFVMVDTTTLNCCLQATANARTIGVSQEGTADTQLTNYGNYTAVYAAQGTESAPVGIKLYGLGDVCELITTNGVTAGDMIESDSSGKGITYTSDAGPRNIGAIALETTTAGEQCRVQVMIFQYSPVSGSDLGNITVDNLTITDSKNIILGTTNGSMLASNVNQKLGFWGATPIVQPSTSGDILGLNGNGATNANMANVNTNGNIGSTYYTLGDVVAILKNTGLAHT